MALNKFILDMLNGKDSTERSFEIWRDETLANQQQLHNIHLLYLQNHFQPRADYEIEANNFIQTNKDLRAEFIRMKTSASLRNWLTHYSNMPDNTTVSKIFTAFS